MERLKKLRLRIISMALAGVLTFSSGCTVNSTKKEKPINRGETSSNISQPVEIPQEQEECLTTKQQIIEEYLKKIEEIEAYYSKNYLPSPELINQILNECENNSRCPYIMEEDLEVEIKKLVEKIIANSQEALKENMDYHLDTSVFSQCGLVIDIYDLLEGVLRDIFETATNDIAEDFCHMQGLRVVFSKGLPEGVVFGWVTGQYDAETNTIIVYPQEIIDCEEVYYKYLSDKDGDTLLERVSKQLDLTLKHELNHARQNDCRHKNNDSMFCRINYTGRDIQHSSVLEEASASSALYNLKQDKSSRKVGIDYTYVSERDLEALIFAAAITKDPEEYYNAMFDGDYDEFFKFFGLEDEEDKVSFLNALNIMDTLELRTDHAYEEFPRFKEEGYIFFEEGEVPKFKKKIGFGYKIDLFKIGIRNLMKYTYEHEDFSLEENYLLFLGMINIILKNSSIRFEETTDLNESCTIDYYQASFVESFKKIEDTYKDFLCKYYDVGLEELEQIEKGEFYRCLSLMLNFDFHQVEEWDLYDYMKKRYIDKDTVIKVEEFMRKFPMLKAISYTEAYSKYSYRYFETATSENADDVNYYDNTVIFYQDCQDSPKKRVLK